MEILGKASLIIHIIAGLLTLIMGPIAIFYNFKNIQNHKRAGKVFFYAMLIVCISSFGGVVKYPDAAFYHFLFGLGLLVFANVIRGVRAIRMMKGGSVIPLDWVYSALLLLTGLAMLNYGVHLLPTQKAIAILLLVFGAFAFADSYKNYVFFRKPAQKNAMDWYQLHIGSMMGAFMASTTAFLVNLNLDIPFYITWFGPTVLLMPIQIYFSRKVAAKKNVV